jgi:hypothetical protein
MVVARKVSNGDGGRVRLFLPGRFSLKKRRYRNVEGSCT